MSETQVSIESSVSTTAGVASVGDYIALMKPTVMSLAVFTAAVGMAVAPVHLHPVLAITALILIAIGAGAAGALNMWYDADIDGLMQRTAKRPIPRGLIPRDEAASFGLFLAAFSVLSLGLLINWVAASLLAASIVFYLVVYTHWLKRRTPQNIVIGGAAGALPPMIGWAAASPGVSWEGFALFLVIFLWTPPHFWALALYRSRDYARAGVPMMPNVYGPDRTRLEILIYTAATALSGFPAGSARVCRIWLCGCRCGPWRGVSVPGVARVPRPGWFRGGQGIPAALYVLDPLSFCALRRSVGGSWLRARTIRYATPSMRKRGALSPRLSSTLRRSAGKGCARSR